MIEKLPLNVVGGAGDPPRAPAAWGWASPLNVPDPVSPQNCPVPVLMTTVAVTC